MVQLKHDPYGDFQCTHIKGVPVYFNNRLPQCDGWVAIRIILGVGARHDPDHQLGLAHFFEHLPFDGCQGYPDFTTIRRVKEELLMDTLNASTSFDRTGFGGTVLASRLNEAGDFFSNFVVRPNLDPTEVDRERRVIVNEMWQKFNSPANAKHLRRVRKELFGNHSLGRATSPFGWPDTIRDIGVDDLQHFHKRYYHRGNLSLVMVGGGIPEAELVTVATTIISEFPESGEVIEHPQPPEFWPLPLTSGYTISAGELGIAGRQQTTIEVGRVCPQIKNTSSVEVLGRMIWEMLFEEVRGKLGAVYTPRVQHSEVASASELRIGLQIPPDATMVTRKIILSIIDDIIRGEKRAVDFFEAKRFIQIDRVRTREYTSGGVADYASFELATRGRIGSSQQDLDEASDLKYTDVQALAEKELEPEKLYWGIIEP